MNKIWETVKWKTRWGSLGHSPSIAPGTISSGNGRGCKVLQILELSWGERWFCLHKDFWCLTKSIFLPSCCFLFYFDFFFKITAFIFFFKPNYYVFTNFFSRGMFISAIFNTSWWWATTRNREWQWKTIRETRIWAPLKARRVHNHLGIYHPESNSQ